MHAHTTDSGISIFHNYRSQFLVINTFLCMLTLFLWRILIKTISLLTDSHFQNAHSPLGIPNHCCYFLNINVWILYLLWFSILHGRMHNWIFTTILCGVIVSLYDHQSVVTQAKVTIVTGRHNLTVPPPVCYWLKHYYVEEDGFI